MQTKTITCTELFGDLREIIILHAGNEYRLRITSNGKLILTK
jgi:hemin uptake protein HemP